jgi:cellobiose phosphorylase
MYPYLTGSASWLLLTMLTELFGVKGNLGDLILEPKLLHTLFDDEEKVSVLTQFADRQLTITYFNPERLDYGDYSIVTIKIDGNETTINQNGGSVIIPRDKITSLKQDKRHEILVELGRPT